MRNRIEQGAFWRCAAKLRGHPAGLKGP